MHEVVIYETLTGEPAEDGIDLPPKYRTVPGKHYCKICRSEIEEGQKWRWFTVYEKRSRCHDKCVKWAQKYGGPEHQEQP